MLRRKMSGFTLIELMVVIVIIGVLASLAIPRFTEASSKAKAAEAPRVIASWESAFLALVAETGEVGAANSDQLIFDITAVSADSKWFGYSNTLTSCGSVVATPAKQIGKLGTTHTIAASYDATKGAFAHSAQAAASGTWKQYTPNFFK